MSNTGKLIKEGTECRCLLPKIYLFFNPISAFGDAVGRMPGQQKHACHGQTRLMMRGDKAQTAATWAGPVKFSAILFGTAPAIQSLTT
ncbi:hypothetical protein HTT03_17860 [Sulfitobacter sp. S0837]|uniref:hypothetical protein n=1 Tax=Sulfitobacter maritimus TaxID=2741719 RepID=UPI001581C039|nr:hypothetical protein [Sulfitobacter maritimus]NUH67154.1 hypothetical protein [Sulfitobacter maritimus]